MGTGQTTNAFSTFLSTVNGDTKEARTPETAQDPAPTPVPDQEEPAKQVLRNLRQGPLNSQTLLERLQAEPNTCIHAMDELQLVLDYLVKSEMVEIDESGLVSLTGFAGQALSVFNV